MWILIQGQHTKVVYCSPYLGIMVISMSENTQRCEIITSEICLIIQDVTFFFLKKDYLFTYLKGRERIFHSLVQALSLFYSLAQARSLHYFGLPCVEPFSAAFPDMQAELEVEQMGLKSAFVWDTSVTGGDLTCCVQGCRVLINKVLYKTAFPKSCEIYFPLDICR